LPKDVDTSLELASTAELINELHRRSALFVYAIRPLVKSPDQTYDFLYGCSRDGGNVDWQAVMSAVGFMEHAKQLMLAKEKQ
jgi:hypothetical protein